MNGVSAAPEIGEVSAFTTNRRGATPEEWAEILMPRLLTISQNTPEPLRQQAEAFQSQMKVFLIGAMKKAIASDRVTLVHHLRAAGFPQFAEAIKDL